MFIFGFWVKVNKVVSKNCSLLVWLKIANYSRKQTFEMYQFARKRLRLRRSTTDFEKTIFKVFEDGDGEKLLVFEHYGY
jgi:hypothetical protein